MDFEIKDIPIMKSEKGEIVCIPSQKEVFSCAIVGTSGSGKTLLSNRLQSHLFYQEKCNVAIMNDLSEETYCWTEPMQTEFFNRFNRRNLNQQPISSPLVFVYPNTKTLFIDTKKLKKKDYLRIVLPFREIIKDMGFYLTGVTPKFDLGKAKNYLNKLEEDFFECSSIYSVMEVLEEKLPQGKSFNAMRIKILSAFSSLMKEEILDVSNPEYSAYFNLIDGDKKTFFQNPFMAIMSANKIPSFITADLITKDYKSTMMAYYVNSILINNKIFKGKKTYLFFDELKDLCTSNSEPLSQSIGLVSSRGRINNVGLVYISQFYNLIPTLIRGAKLTYCFSFQHSNSKILDEIGADFDLERETKKQIKNLRKFEVVAMTNNKFIIYDEDGERYETSKPIKGKIFFPLSDHKK